MNDSKDALRKECRIKREAIQKQDREIYDKKIFNHIISLREYIDAELILTYVSFGTEADTHLLIRQSLLNGKKVAVPKVLNDRMMEFYLIENMDDLHSGKMGILEPESDDMKAISNCLDDDVSVFMCIPGLVFGRNMGRIGYGGGYYDRYLASHFKKEQLVTKAGLLYDCQLYDHIGLEKHDWPLDLLIMPSEIID